MTVFRLTRPRLIVALVVAIAVSTMASTNGPLRPFSFCLTCNYRWLADWLANVLMFLPLGCAMNWKRRHFNRAALRIAGFSIVIEMVQTTLPGRDPALADIIANSLGGALGAWIGSRPSVWLTPPPRLADRLLAVAVVLAAAIVGETEWLLAPSSNLTLGSGLSSAVEALFRRQATMVFTTVTKPAPEEQGLFSVGGPRPFDALYVGRAANNAILRYRSRSRDLRLDGPDYPVADFFDATGKVDTLRITVSRDGPAWCLSRTGKRQCGLGPTVGLGWSILRYPYSLDRRWQRSIDAVWTALLFFPVGFWSRRRTIAIAVIASAIILGPLARFALLLPTPPGEWLGAFAGLGSAATLAFWLRRRLQSQSEKPPSPLLT